MRRGKGFADTLASLWHHSNFHYRKPAEALIYCSKPRCGWHPPSPDHKRNPRDTRLHIHWRNYHAEAAYDDPNTFAKDDVCQKSSYDPNKCTTRDGQLFSSLHRLAVSIKTLDTLNCRSVWKSVIQMAQEASKRF